jgi:hypothetical protein
MNDFLGAVLAHIGTLKQNDAAARQGRPWAVAKKAGRDPGLYSSVIASEAKQSIAQQGSVDCFVATLLAMTRETPYCAASAASSVG